MFMENVPLPMGRAYLNCGALGAVFCTTTPMTAMDAEIDQCDTTELFAVHARRVRRGDGDIVY